MNRVSKGVVRVTVIVVVLGLLVSSLSCNKSSQSTIPDNTSLYITGHDWVQMTSSQKRAWINTALDAIDIRGELGEGEIEATDYYVSELGMVYSDQNALNKQVAWSLRELTSHATSATLTPMPIPISSVTDAIARVEPAVVRLVTEESYGSGMIIDEAGYVLTNSHVVKDANSVIIMLSDGRQFEGMVIGRDNIRDLAVVKIEGGNLPIVPLGDSNELELGQELIAIGYPLGLKGSATVSKGIFSAFRTNVVATYIQTDAAINPGSSGGALINLNGEVIGVNTLKLVGVAFEGMSYAITIDSAKPIIPSLIASDEQTSGLP